ncbi:MAG TPA: hypothetical protein DDW27_20730 [Bacteroidales bacterium]|nr:hypothetical protein [Bacteroidales bacterium]
MSVRIYPIFGDGTPTPVSLGIGVSYVLKKVFPEAVNECKNGYLDFNMHAVNVAMVNAIKELKAENDDLKT